jgi:protein SCO1/2
MKTVRIALWIVVALALFGLGALAIGGSSLMPKQEAASAPSPGAPLGGAFALVDGKGAPVTEAIFRGKPSITLFGYTHCPDICPTGLMEMSRWAEELGPDADKLRFVFVTVDPERDTPQAMQDYVTAFSDRIVGISGAPEKVHAMVQDYKIYSRKVPLDGGDYTMDHTASMILQDAEGNFVGTIDPAEAHETALAKLRRLVAG